MTSPRPQEPHPLRQSASPVDVPHEERDGAVIVIAAAKSKDLNLSRWIMRFSRRAVSRKERAANMILQALTSPRVRGEVGLRSNPGEGAPPLF